MKWTSQELPQPKHGSGSEDSGTLINNTGYQIQNREPTNKSVHHRYRRLYHHPPVQQQNQLSMLKSLNFLNRLGDLPHTPIEIIFWMVMNTIIICARFLVYHIDVTQIVIEFRVGQVITIWYSHVVATGIQMTVADLDTFYGIPRVQTSGYYEKTCVDYTIIR